MFLLVYFIKIRAPVPEAFPRLERLSKGMLDENLKLGSYWRKGWSRPRILIAACTSLMVVETKPVFLPIIAIQLTAVKQGHQPN